MGAQIYILSPLVGKYTAHVDAYVYGGARRCLASFGQVGRSRAVLVVMLGNLALEEEHTSLEAGTGRQAGPVESNGGRGPMQERCTLYLQMMIFFSFVNYFLLKCIVLRLATSQHARAVTA